MRRILLILALLAIPAVAQFGGPMGGMRPGSMQGGGLLPGRGGDPLWIAAGPTKPTLDFDFAKRKDLTDAVSGGTSLVTFARPASQSPGTYVGADGLIKTAAVNRALYSEQFDQWTNSSTTDAANQTDAPDNKQTADTITATGANGTITRGVTTTAINYTFSVYIKRKTGTGDIDISADGSTWVTQSVTGEWQRFSVTQTGVAGTSNPGIRIVTSGDEVYAWGAQLEEGSTATPYIKTTSQALAAPRFDHDPVTGESLGLLVEEARTNLVLNSDTLTTQSVTTTAAAHTLSFYGTGTVDLTGTHTATVVGTGAYPARTTLTFTPTAGTLTLTVTGTVQYAQLEAGAFPTSYIPTTTSAQTRFADVAAVQDEDFSTTNLLSYSESFDVGWDATGTSGSTVSPNAIVSPNGTLTADKLEEDATTGTHRIAQAKTVSASTHTFSVYAKAAERSQVYIFIYDTTTRGGAYFDLVSGAISGVIGSASIQDAGGGWFKCTVTGTFASTSARAFISIANAGSELYPGTSGNGIYLWGASLTATEYPVEYIKTEASPVTEYRWYEPTEGTIYAIASSAGIGTRGIAGIDDNTANERIELQTDGTDPEFVVIDGGAGSTLDTGTIMAYTFFNLTGAYKHNDLAATVGGLAVQTATDTVPTVDRMRVGALQASGTYLNGHIKRLIYWPVRQPDATLQVITQ